jgi:SAM-dependent methyltransferase
MGIPQRVRRIASLFLKHRRCPCCGWRGVRFEPFGNRMLRRGDASCPICGSLERHRAARLLIGDRISRGQKVLHVAPEAQMINWLVSLSSEYLNVDLYNPAMQKMDLTDTGLPDSSKTLVWCSHVLEHIPDDAKALSEIYRILAPGGVLIAQVPIGGDTTFEDWSVTGEEERLAKFLQEDHVRLYGRDLKARMEAAGFKCEVLTTEDLSPTDQTLYAVRHPAFREVFLARRPEAV